MRRAFVTGGSGFVGRSLIPALLQGGFSVRALARSERAAAVVREAGAEAVRGDLEDAAGLRDGMADCEYVFHSAAKVEPWGTRAEFMRANVTGTEHILAAARTAGARRLVHVSTEAVLVGGPRLVRADETWPRARRPAGLYAETKGLAEARVLAANASGLETVIVRPRMIWGRGDTTVLPQLIQRIRQGTFAWIGGGRHLTSTCHVRNVCEGAILAAERGRPGETYFLTDGQPVEMREFMTTLLRSQGIEVPDRSVPFWVAYLGGVLAEVAWRILPLRGDPPFTRMAVKLVGEEVTVSDEKARRELGYRANVSIEEGVAELAVGSG